MRTTLETHLKRRETMLFWLNDTTEFEQSYRCCFLWNKPPANSGQLCWTHIKDYFPQTCHECLFERVAQNRCHCSKCYDYGHFYCSIHKRYPKEEGEGGGPTTKLGFGGFVADGAPAQWNYEQQLHSWRRICLFARAAADGDFMEQRPPPYRPRK